MSLLVGVLCIVMQCVFSLICIWTTSWTIICGSLFWDFFPRIVLTQWPKGLLRNMSEDKTPFRAALRRRRRPHTAPIPTPSTPSRFAWVNFSLSQYLGYYLTLYFATNSFNRINKSSECKCCYVAFGFWPLNNDQHSQLFATLLWSSNTFISRRANNANGEYILSFGESFICMWRFRNSGRAVPS